MGDPKISPENFFYVKDGVIETPGVPVGYLRTDKEYENYQLHTNKGWNRIAGRRIKNPVPEFVDRED